MRTTLTEDIDPDVLAAAKALAARRRTSLGSALSELARRGLRSTRTVQDEGNATVFAAATDGKTITSEDVQRSLNDWP